MHKYKVELDEKTCIGCRACTVACDNFVAKNDKAVVVKEIIDQTELKLNTEAKDACPVSCIQITKIEEEK